MRNVLTGLVALACVAPTAYAFCGFYVAQDPGSLFNESSKVVLVRDGDHTVLTMANDFKGNLRDFGLVVPVPQEITPGMVKVAESAILEKLDQYTVPRLVEYYDPDPCYEPPKYDERWPSKMAMEDYALAVARKRQQRPRARPASGAS